MATLAQFSPDMRTELACRFSFAKADQTNLQQKTRTYEPRSAARTRREPKFENGTPGGAGSAAPGTDEQACIMLALARGARETADPTTLRPVLWREEADQASQCAQTSLGHG